VPVPMSSRLRIVDMEGPDFVPVRRVLAEIAGSRLGPCPPHRREALAIPGEAVLIRRQEIEDLACDAPARAIAMQPIEHPAALRQPVEQPGIAELLEMARNPGLALAEDLGELADGELAMGAERHQAQARRLRRSPQAGKDLFQVGHGGHI
jgi:hypothetical protein